MDNFIGSNGGGTTAVSIYQTQATSPINKLAPRVNIPLRVDLVDRSLNFGGTGTPSQASAMKAARNGILTPNAAFRTLSPEQMRQTTNSGLVNRYAERRGRNYSTIIGGTE